MNIENIATRRKDYEMQLQDAIDNLNETIDSKLEKRYSIEIDFLLDQIKLLKKWEKIIEKNKEEL